VGGGVTVVVELKAAAEDVTATGFLEGRGRFLGEGAVGTTGGFGLVSVSTLGDAIIRVETVSCWSTISTAMNASNRKMATHVAKASIVIRKRVVTSTGAPFLFQS
jgi:hypothetical protein